MRAVSGAVGALLFAPALSCVTPSFRPAEPRHVEAGGERVTLVRANLRAETVYLNLEGASPTVVDGAWIADIDCHRRSSLRPPPGGQKSNLGRQPRVEGISPSRLAQACSISSSTRQIWSFACRRMAPRPSVSPFRSPAPKNDGFLNRGGAILCSPGGTSPSGFRSDRGAIRPGLISSFSGSGAGGARSSWASARALASRVAIRMTRPSSYSLRRR